MIMNCAAAFCAIFCLIPVLAQSPKYPIVLVPGDGGSQFEAKLNKSETVHWYCYKISDWYLIWLSGLQLQFVECMVDNMRLVYDNVSRTTLNQQGVEIRQPGFGNTSTVEWLDPTHPVFAKSLSYFYYIVEFLVKNMSYTRNVNIRGAPYDFRKAPNEMSEFLKLLVNLIEETYYRNNETKVVLLGHSMGNLVVLYMLNRQPQNWKDKYIRSFISLGGPWGGSVKPLRLMASGDSLGQSSHIIKPLQVRPLQRSIPSTSWLMPYDSFWTDKEVLVYSPLANYTVKDYRQFFNDINFPDGYMMREDNEDLIKKLDPPGVEIYCIYGNNVSTPDAFSYLNVRGAAKATWYDSQPDVINGDGDGTVNIRSLRACQRWTGKQAAKVVWKEFPKVEHLDMLQNSDIQSYIRAVLLAD